MQSLTLFQSLCSFQWWTPRWGLVWRNPLWVLTSQISCPVFLPSSLFFFVLLAWCFLEAAQAMMGWSCCSAVRRALILLAFLVFPLCGRGCWGLDPSSGDLKKSPHSDPDPWEVLQRHKRSWVWNQFFVLEEFTGNEPLYVGKVSDVCDVFLGQRSAQESPSQETVGFLFVTPEFPSSPYNKSINNLPLHK